MPTFRTTARVPGLSPYCRASVFGPQRQHRLVPAIAVVRAFGGALVAVDHSGVDIQGCRLHWPTALQIEDEFGIGLGQTQQRHRLGGDRRLALRPTIKVRRRIVPPGQ
jgi:hypothetical protein